MAQQRVCDTVLHAAETNDDRYDRKTETITFNANETQLERTRKWSISSHCPLTSSSSSSISTTPTNSYPTGRSDLYETALGSQETLGDSTSNDFYTITEDPDDRTDYDKTVTGTSFAFQTCTQTPVVKRIVSASKAFRDNIRRHSLSSILLSRFQKRTVLSIKRCDSIDIPGCEQNCACEENFVDGNCLKSFMEMSVQPAEYRNTTPLKTSTPIIGKDFDHGIFNIARIKKVELHDLSPKVTELNAIDTSVTDRCINNNNVRTPNGNHLQQPKIFIQNSSPITPIAPIRLQPNEKLTEPMTVSTPEDGNVLKKIISFTLEQMSNGEHAANTIAASKPTRPSIVPEKLNFSAYEQFEGQMLINWMCSTILKSANLNEYDTSVLQMLVSQICTNFLAAGVLRQIVDNDDQIKDVFCPYEMYRWTYTEQSRLQQNQNLPKKLDVNRIETQLDLNESQREVVHTIIDLDEKEKVNAIKTKLMACDSIASIYGEIKSVLADVEHYAQENDIVLTNGRDSGLSMDGVDPAQIHLNFNKTNQQLTTNNQTNDKVNCDSKVTRSYINCCTQTEQPLSTHDAESKADNGEKAEHKPTDSVKPPPPPPPMPNFSLPTCLATLPAPPPPPLPPNLCNSNASSPATFTPSPMPIQIQNIETKLQCTLSPITNVNSPNIKGPTSANTSAVLSNNASSFCPPPPPPMNGIPGPPPLPLPSGNLWFKSDTLRKTAKHPPKPMINLFWTRIIAPKPEDVVDDESGDSRTSTPTMRNHELWQEIDETKLENLDEFTELFSRQATPKRVLKETPSRITKRKYIKVLDHKRSQSVGIFAQSLNRLRIDSQAIERAIYNCDTTTINLDLMQQLLEHQASEEELKSIAEAAKAQNEIQLDGPEKFLLAFSEISCASERIGCLLFRAEFEESSAQITRKFETVEKLCEFLMQSEQLKNLFSIILTLGNYMNGGNRFRGQADGFGLDVLSKLRDVKSRDKKVTLLHFIVKTHIAKQRTNGVQVNELVYPVPDVNDIMRACSIDFVILNEEIKRMKNRLLDFEKHMETVIQLSTDINIQPFKDLSEAFLQQAKETIDQQDERLIQCQDIFHRTLEFYKYIPKTGTLDDCTPSQFFELWSSFAADFRDIWKKEINSINAEIVQKLKSVSSPKTPLQDRSLNRSRAKLSSGIRVRRINHLL